MAILIEITEALAVTVLILTVAFAIFVRSHNHTYPDRREVRRWEKGSFR
jgi:hypothetical protein